MKIDPYYQRLKSSAETLFCEDIKVMPIFEGSLDRGHEVRVVSSKITIFSCGRYIIRNFMCETKIIMSEFVVPNGFSSTSKQVALNDLMTSKSDFTVKYCFLSGIV